MCVALRDRDERAFSYERVPTDAQKGRRKQGENERKKILKSSLFLPSLSIFIFFSAFFQ
jgi:hypothetical protein